MNMKNFVANQFRKPTGLWGKLAVKMMMKGNIGAINWAIASSNIKSSDVVLEIGFGHGLSFPLIAEKTDGKIYGLDFSEDMVRMASQRNIELINQGKLDLKFGEVSQAPFANNFFDKIIAVNVIYFWKEPQKELAEIKRILKPGGRVVLYLTDKMSMEKISFANTSVFNKYSADEFEVILNHAGFANVNHETKMFRNGQFICHCMIAEKGN